MYNNEKISFFLPVRKGNERVKNKNTRPFGPYSGGLLENKLIQLRDSQIFDEIILSTNDQEAIDIASRLQISRLKIKLRPDNLCQSSTSLTDLIRYVPTITEAAHIVWGHVTTPFTNGIDYEEAVATYFSQRKQGYDSLMGVSKFQNFLVDINGKVFNNSSSLPWPRTQDLTPLFEINHSLFIAPRQIYLEQFNRIGKKPFLHQMGKLQSFDVDWEEDFAICEMICNALLSS